MNQDIQQVQVDINVAREKIAYAKDLADLRKNRAFKRLINELYLKDECVRLTLLKSVPSMQNVEDQTEILKDLDGIGSLFQFFCAIEGEGRTMSASLADHERMLAALEAEEAGGYVDDDDFEEGE